MRYSRQKRRFAPACLYLKAVYVHVDVHVNVDVDGLSRIVSD
jgi:hypothetical protein